MASVRSNPSRIMSQYLPVQLSSAFLVHGHLLVRLMEPRHDARSAQPRLMQLRQPLFGSVRARFWLLSCRVVQGVAIHRPSSCCGCSPVNDGRVQLVHRSFRSICWPRRISIALALCDSMAHTPLLLLSLFCVMLCALGSSFQHIRQTLIEQAEAALAAEQSAARS